MTREEWYKHTMVDHIQSLCEYVEIMRDEAMETDMEQGDISELYYLLIALQCDISKQLKRYELAEDLKA